MYLNHYQLKLMPFEIGPDPKFLWLGSKHKEAFAMLRYGILESKGFIVIIGDPGTGKSTLLNATAANFGSNIRFAQITDPALDEMDFFNFVANAFEMGKTFQSKAEFLIRLREFVNDAGAQSKKVILVIDEAQRLTSDMLEQIRVFSNVETPGQKVVSCIFAGQTEFLDLVEQNRALAQRVFFSHIIQPLTQSETADYIAHRLKVSGTEEPIFTSAAVQEVFRLSAGNPRLINILCDQALLNGYGLYKKKIGPELIEESTENTLIPLNAQQESTAEAQKQEPAKQSTSTSTEPAAENTTGPSRIAPAKTGLRTPARKTVYWAPIALTVVLGLAAYFYLNDGLRSASTGSQTDLGQTQSSAQPAEPTLGAGEIGRLQDQMLELRRQKDDAETRLRELQTQFRVLEKDQKELKAAKARIVEFENAMALKDKDLSATAQKLKEAEKALAQEKSAKDGRVGEFSSKEAAVEVVRAQTGMEINASVNACLDRFYRQVPGAKEFTGKARGVLVMPNVAKSGFIVDGEYGKGALRVEKKTVSYYNLTSGSVGFQIGGEAKDIVMLFMTDEALKQFQASQGWEVGVDANVALVKIGGSERVDFTKMQDPIIGFIFDVKGFMADISFKGAKFTKITPK